MTLNPERLYERVGVGDRVEFRAEALTRTTAEITDREFATEGELDVMETGERGIIVITAVTEPDGDADTPRQFILSSTYREQRWTDLTVDSCPWIPELDLALHRDMTGHRHLTEFSVEDPAFPDLESRKVRERERRLDTAARILESAADRAREGRPLSARDTARTALRALSDEWSEDLDRAREKMDHTPMDEIGLSESSEGEE